MEKSLSAISLLSAWNELHDSVIKATEINEENRSVDIMGVKGSLTSFFIQQFLERKKALSIHKEQYAGIIRHYSEDCLIIVPTSKEANEYETDLQTVFGEKARIYKFPDWGALPYRASSKGAVVFGERTGILSKLVWKSHEKDIPRIFIATQRCLLSPQVPPSYIRKLSVNIQKGQTFDSETLAALLSERGYLRVPRVSMKGEFALRGEVLDVFMPGEENAHRILFDFDKIENIKTFDVETQSTKLSTKELLIYPMKEVVWTDELVKTLDEKLTQFDKTGVQFDSEFGTDLKSDSLKNLNSEVHLTFSEDARMEQNRILNELKTNGESVGEDLFYGLLWDKKYSIFDYISPNSSVFFADFDRLKNGQKSLNVEFEGAYRLARKTLPVLPPKDMFFDFSSIISVHSASIRFRSLETLDSDSAEIIELHSEEAQSFFGNINYFKEQISALQKENWHIFIFADNQNQSLRIEEVVKEFIYTDAKFPLTVIPNAITEGFSISAEKILVIQENEIFGRRRAAPKSIRKAKSRVIDTFVELNPGDYVVHVNYGIGLFKGIERVKSMGTERDYIKLEYAGQEFVFVPIEQVNMVQRYIGNEANPPALDLIGSKSWNSRKARAQKKVEEIAQKLIDLYSKRKASRGFPFEKDSEWQAAFEAAFPYEDTPDQFTATQEIKADMERPVPMDRLVCGDVGYGKTEIAMRAAFKAVMSGKQVAFLAPTTILAEQHYENCLERFKNFPVQIAQLSRFVSPAEQKKVLAALAEGKIDILVGTHRILQKDVLYKDLGLMIIDEEQRFGVKDKEKLKILKTNIDCLAMSATPIPRTLHMSLLKIRDMSLLTTPPQNRQPIETVIEESSDEKIAMAIRREVDRGGQVFFLHNRVESLEETRLKIEHLVPEMLVDVAHGQMTSEQLDDIFRRFKMGGFNVLVATTIIENGIDIPNVNTIIIDRADMYGVSQLYQLRGRVGRSDRKAYAYLFYPKNKALTEVAMKRLQVISDFTELGSGFKIAMKDMEIRGAGNLLGKDQSGEVYAVGFEMYLNLLNAAIEKLSSSDWHAPEEVSLELEYTGFIPDSYILDAETKMEMYKKIASIGSDSELDAVFAELYDRFGSIPDEVNSLLSLAKIRIICNKLSISSLKERNGIVTVEFAELAKVNVDKVLKLVKTNSGKVRLNPTAPNQLILQTGQIDLKAKGDFIREKLSLLA